MMQTGKSWDDYLTESSSTKDPPNSKDRGTSGHKYKSTNPFRINEVSEHENEGNVSYNILNSDMIAEVMNNNEHDQTNDKNTLDSLESIDIYPFGDSKLRTAGLLSFGRKLPQSPLKDLDNDNHMKKEDRETSLFGTRTEMLTFSGMKRVKGYNEPKVFGGNFRYMKGYLKSSIRSSDVEKENRFLSDDGSLSNELGIDSTVPRLQQELKSTRRKVERLRDMNMSCVRRKEELQEEVLCAHKELTELKIALQTSTDKQNEYQIEMRIAKARVDEAEREAAIAIGQGNKLERELDDLTKRSHSDSAKLSTADKTITSLTEDLTSYKEKYREEAKSKQEVMELAESRCMELKNYEKEIELLKSKLKESEEGRTSALKNAELTLQEKARCEGKIEELTKSNNSIKDDYAKLQMSMDSMKEKFDNSTRRIEEQKEKFESMIASRVNIEKEMSEMHEELDRQKKDKETIFLERNRFSERLDECQFNFVRVKEEKDTLERENSSMKDKLLYLEHFKKVIDAKTLNFKADLNKPLQGSCVERKESKSKMTSSGIEMDRKEDEKDINLTDQNVSKSFNVDTENMDILSDEDFFSNLDSNNNNTYISTHQKITKTTRLDAKDILKKLEDMKQDYNRLMHKELDASRSKDVSQEGIEQVNADKCSSDEPRA